MARKADKILKRLKMGLAQSCLSADMLKAAKAKKKAAVDDDDGDEPAPVRRPKGYASAMMPKERA